MSAEHDPLSQPVESQPEQADSERETVTFLVGGGPKTFTVYRDDWEAPPSPEAQEFVRGAVASYRKMASEGRIDY